MQLGLAMRTNLIEGLVKVKSENVHNPMVLIRLL